MRMTTMRGHDLARASARSTGKVLAALIVALCALMVGTHDAYAITVRDDGNGYKRAIVYPHDYPNGRYAALAEFLGYDWNSFSQQTKTAIIEDDGKFMELYRARCKNYRYENENLQDGSGSVIGAITTKLAEVVDSVSGAVFGNDETWYCSCTDADYDAARANIQEWLYPNNGSGGGSGGGGTEGDEPEYDGTYYYIDFTDETAINTSNYSGVALTTNVYNSLVDAIDNAETNYPNEEFSVITFLCLQNINLGITSEEPLISNQYYVSFPTGSHYNYIIMPSAEVTTYNEKQYLIFNTTLNNNIYTSTGTFHSSPLFKYNWDASVNGGSGSGGGEGGGGEPYVPTPDPTPTPPVIQIGDVTVDLSNGPYTVNNVTYTAVLDNDNNWTVQVTTNTTNNYGGDVQATDPTDYTSILNAILAAINSLRSEMTTYTNQINSNITTAINSLNNSIKNVETTIKNKLDAFKQQMHQDIQTLQTNLQNNFNGKFDAYTTQLWSNMAALDADLLEAIHNAAVYVVDGLYWDGGMDDGEVVRWLKMIYSRLKDKKVTVPSVDEDPEDWLDRLREILDGLLNAILSGLNVATLATAFEGLKTRFPISIPWDIAAIVNMFAGGAVTPVFDLPLPNGTNGSYTTVHVDLHEWDDEMALVRQGELLLFGIVLMYNTKWMFDTVTMTFRRGE